MICLEIQEAGAETRLDRAIYSLVDDRTELKAQQIIVAASKIKNVSLIWLTTLFSGFSSIRSVFFIVNDKFSWLTFTQEHITHSLQLSY